MLIALRAILLVLFIAAPFGEQRTAAGLPPVADDFAADAILNCPSTEGVPHEGDTWTAVEDGTTARSEASGENA